MRHAVSALLAVSAVACAASGAPATAGFFSGAQVDRGARAFESACRECHGLGDFRGEAFEWEWRRRTAWDFFDRMTMTMPEDNPGMLTDATYIDLVAFILSLNGYARGGGDLMPTPEALGAIPMGPGASRRP